MASTTWWGDCAPRIVPSPAVSLLAPARGKQQSSYRECLLPHNFIGRSQLQQLLSTLAMLSFQVFRPSSQFSCNQLSASHYLSCGSFSTPLTIRNLYQFSKYKVNPYTKFTDSVKKQNKDTLFLVLSGEGKFDGKIVGQGDWAINPIEVSATDKPFSFVRVTLHSKSQQVLQKKRQNEVVSKQQWSIFRYEMKQNQGLPLNESSRRVFAMVEKGEVSVQGKAHPLVQSEAVLTTKKTLFTAKKASSLIVVQIPN